MRKVCALLILSCFSLTLSAAVNVQEIQQKIENQKAQWVAKSTSVSQLSQKEMKKLLGNNDVITSELDYSDVYSESKTYESIDWRNVNGLNWVGPIMSQGNCGSCVAFATIATIETQMSINAQAPWLTPHLSQQALFSCGGGSCANGWYTSNAANFATRAGLIDSACSPYTMGSDGNNVACQEFCPGQNKRTVKVAKSFNPTGGIFSNSAKKLKEALKRGPVVTSMMVYEDFYAYAGGIYQSVNRRPVGGHAVSIVGFNDQERYWIIRNSWGENWGEKGFAKISWDDLSKVGASTIGFELSTVSDVLSIASPQENEYISGDFNLAVQSILEKNISLKLLKNRQEVQTIQMNRETKNMLNTLNLENGNYEMVAVSNENPNLKSLTRGFTVSNQKPTMAIEFKGHNDLDLSRPVTGRIEFDVLVTSEPVQMQKVELIITKLDGTVVSTKTTNIVLKNMLIGSRFNVFPDGEYMVFFRGYLPAMGKIFTVDSSKIKIKNEN